MFPASISAGADGNLWFTTFGEPAVGRVTPTGTVSIFPISTSGPGQDITAGPDHNMWFTDTNNTVERLGTGVPDPPSDVSVAGAATSASVSWLAPMSSGDTPVTSYTVTASPGGETCTWSAGPLSCVVSGLVHGATYTVTVTAANAVGSSAPSARSSPITLDGTYFRAVMPLRILDSRPGPGNIGGYSTPWGPGVIRDIQVAGEGGVPSDADAVALNVTVTNGSASSFLEAFPAGTPPPTVSNLNFSADETIANQVTAKVGADGKVSILNHSGSVDVVVDVTGYYRADAVDGFTSVTPPRLLDSRPGTGNTGGYASPWRPGTRRDVQVSGLDGVPSGADAVVLNVTATDSTAPSYLTIWPQRTPRPTASSLNFTAGETIANALTVELNASNGKLSIYNLAGATDVVVDVAGYFQAGTGALFHPLTPARILDSRPEIGNVGGYSTPWGSGTTRTLDVTGAGSSRPGPTPSSPTSPSPTRTLRPS